MGTSQRVEEEETPSLGENLVEQQVAGVQGEAFDTQARAFIEKTTRELAQLTPRSLRTIVRYLLDLLRQPEKDLSIRLSSAGTNSKQAIITFHSRADFEAYGESEWGGAITLSFSESVNLENLLDYSRQIADAQRHFVRSATDTQEGPHR